jgi:NAD-dependent deacetylase sirtuin 4
MQSTIVRSAAPLCLPRIDSFGCLGRDGQKLIELFDGCKKLLVITGAGVSTESGIPDYRSPGRPEYKPLQHNDFIKSEYVRRRYWARSFVGYGKVGNAQPNLAHTTLALMENHGKVANLITQNVDRLHHKAGHQRVLELHGTIHEVECLSCSHSTPRHRLQDTLLQQNAAWLQRFRLMSHERPDGDSELPENGYADFTPPACEGCGSRLLKPRVTFHGGALPPATAAAAWDLAVGCDGLLVVGSTLSTFSAFRLAREAARGKVEAAAGEVLAALARRLGLPQPDSPDAAGGGASTAEAGGRFAHPRAGPLTL